MLAASCGLCLLLAVTHGPQELAEPISTDEPTAAQDLVPTNSSALNASADTISQRQPITKAELEAAFGPEALAITNEQLRQEIVLLAREYRESERHNEIRLFGLGAGVALVFLGIGFLIGKRFGGQRLR